MKKNIISNSKLPIYLNSCVRLKLSFENPLLDELIKNIFKEASKQSASIDLNYKTCSLRCLADLVQFSSMHFKDAYFEQFWSSVLENYFGKEVEELISKEKTRYDYLVEQYKNKNKIDDPKTETKETSETNATEVNKEVDEVSNKKAKSKKETDADLDEDDEEARKNGEAIKLIILESVGKCWSYSSDIQGFYTRTFIISNFCVEVIFFCY